MACISFEVDWASECFIIVRTDTDRRPRYMLCLCEFENSKRVSQSYRRHYSHKHPEYQHMTGTVLRVCCGRMVVLRSAWKGKIEKFVCAEKVLLLWSDTIVIGNDM